MKKKVNASKLLSEHWEGIRDGIIFDLKMIAPEEIDKLEIVRSIEANHLKVEIFCRVPNAQP